MEDELWSLTEAALLSDGMTVDTSVSFARKQQGDQNFAGCVFCYRIL